MVVQPSDGLPYANLGGISTLEAVACRVGRKSFQDGQVATHREGTGRHAESYPEAVATVGDEVFSVLTVVRVLRELVPFLRERHPQVSLACHGIGVPELDLHHAPRTATIATSDGPDVQVHIFSESTLEKGE